MQSKPDNQVGVGVGADEVVAEKICVVYHSETGEIRHIHHTLTLHGGTTRKEQEIEARAIELALSSMKGRDRSKLKTLLVAPEHFEPHKAYKVHPKKRQLVEVKRKSPQAG